MTQLSLFSADARPAAVADLAGLLCGPGQVVRFGAGDQARISVVLSDAARGPAVRDACAAMGVSMETVVTDSGSTALRTAFRSDLVELARAWTRGAVKTVPPEWQLDGSTLRLWAMVAGRLDDRGGFVVGLDPHAPQTHQQLLVAATRAGLAPVTVARGAALRISGARRMQRLAELVGPPPPGVPGEGWPRFRERHLNRPAP